MTSELTLDTLGDLDGGSAREIVNAALRSALTDLEDRGDDGKPRKVTITLHVHLLDNGQAAAKVDAKTTIPAYSTHATIANMTRREGRAGLQFQGLAPDNPNQKTLDEFERKEE